MKNSPLSISIIIPLLNEETHIEETLRSVTPFSPDCEIILVDGGSSDGSLDIVRKFPVILVHSPRGRGSQCNAGAKAATGNIFIFLHADTLFPADGMKQIKGLFINKTAAAAQFRMRFNREHPVLKIYSWFTRFSSLFTSFGDRGIIISREFFQTLGGFPEWPLLEDVDFLRRARKAAGVRTLPAYAVSSCRMYIKRGFLRQTIRNGYLLLRYFMGTPPEKLYRQYYRKIPGR